MGPYELTVAMDGPPSGGPWPVVVISHGSGGSPLTHRELGLHLARAGFLVLMPEHPRNNRHDNSLANSSAILEQRPRDVRAAISWATSADGFGEWADTRRVQIVGHSLGGYTALALAGGRPLAFAHESADGIAGPVPVEHDLRVSAVVLFAPAAPWFREEGSLDDVRAPILMLTAEHDPYTPAGHGALIAARVPDPALLEHRVVRGAGHFSFLAPFPAAMTNPAFPPSQDPPGFDRPAFHAALYPEVAAFLTRHAGQ
jgi:predicted dienelactone hydrolase